MRTISLAFTLVLLFLSPIVAQEMKEIPSDVKNHMERMVGEWTFKGHQGNRKFSGEEKIRLTNKNTALIQEGYFDLEGGKKEHYVILSGWDGSKKTVLVRGFTSEGLTWTGEWKKLTKGKWLGNASGGAATFEVKADSMRYEDAGEGTPWISEFTRRKPKKITSIGSYRFALKWS